MREREIWSRQKKKYKSSKPYVVNMIKKNAPFLRKTFWIGVVLSAILSFFYLFSWTGLVGHYRSTALYLIHFVVFNFLAIIFSLFLILKIRSSRSINLKLEEKRSLIIMGVASLVFGALMLLLSLFFNSLNAAWSYPFVFLTPLLSPLLLILQGILLIRYSSKKYGVRS